MSSYYLQLQQSHPDVAARYLSKLQIINGLDPFVLKPVDMSEYLVNAPKVKTIDILAYLVFSHSFYTKEEIKAYKSLEAYKYLEGGFVKLIGFKEINGYIITVGKVKHSQRMNLPPLDVWILSQTSGEISTAHCTCMAGCSEVCSHVGACLFALEKITIMKMAQSCTDLPATWQMPTTSKSVPIVPISEMNWGTIIKDKTTGDIPPLNNEEIGNLLTIMKSKNLDCPLMRFLEPFAEDFQNATISIDNPFANLYKHAYEQLTYDDLLNVASTLSFVVSNEIVMPHT